jgi:hypothetical protein
MSKPSGDLLEALSELGRINKCVPVVGIIVRVKALLMFVLGLFLSAR